MGIPPHIIVNNLLIYNDKFIPNTEDCHRLMELARMLQKRTAKQINSAFIIIPFSAIVEITQPSFLHFFMEFEIARTVRARLKHID